MKYLPFILALLVFPTLAFAQTTTDSAFVPLTNIPFLVETGNAYSLETFLNGLYRIAIGAAAVLAVLQIMRAGIMYMGGDSVTEKKEAKNLIGLAIGGLVLVLSPVIVFSLINPEILSLRIGNIDDLAPASTTPVATCSPACTGGQVCVGGTCAAPNGQGDGTCSTDCVSGRECRQGQCVAMDTASCPTLSNGQALPDTRLENCCAAQRGCEVKARTASGSSLGIESFCSCTPPRYGWRAHVQQGENGSSAAVSRSGFSSTALCDASFAAYLQDNGLLMSDNQPSLCVCGKPLSEQTGCTNL